VVADILEIARMRRAGATEASDHALGYPYSAIKPAKVKPMDRIACQYYLRFMAEDKPGVLGRIASVLGRRKISIASMIQQGRAEVSVPVVMRTHESYERDLTLALAEIRRRKIVKAEPVFIRIEERL
jgi:homoserine dehydrogenase